MDIELFILSAGATENETAYNHFMADEIRRLHEMNEEEREEELEKRRAGKDGKQ